MHETIPLQILDPFIEIFDVGHTCSRLGSNRRIAAGLNEPAVSQDGQWRTRR